MRILVDMDGVLADFEKGFLDNFRKKYPNYSFVPLEKRTSFYLTTDYPPQLTSAVESIYTEKGFYLNLLPIPGSLTALTQMKKRGDDVFICTSPLLQNPYCVSEKYEWVKNYLGDKWTKRLIITKDKTIVDGEVLIDDKPEISGLRNPPFWEHILYDQPYNRTSQKRRLTWQNWKEIVYS